MKLLSHYHPCPADEMLMLLNKLLLLIGSDMSIASGAHKLDVCMQLLPHHHTCVVDEMPLLLNKLSCHLLLELLLMKWCGC